ncbi:hypothetical protein ACGWY0_002665 [Enterococcus hirae]
MISCKQEEIINKLVDDIILKINLQNSYDFDESIGLAFVPIKPIDKCEQFFNKLSYSLSDKKIKILSVDMGEPEENNLYSKECIKGVKQQINCSLQDRINLSYFINHPVEYVKLLENEELKDLFKKYDLVLFKYNINIFEKIPHVVHLYKDFILMMNKKQIYRKELEKIKRMNELYQFNYVSTIIM